MQSIKIFHPRGLALSLPHSLSTSAGISISVRLALKKILFSFSGPLAASFFYYIGRPIGSFKNTGLFSILRSLILISSNNFVTTISILKVFLFCCSSSSGTGSFMPIFACIFHKGHPNLLQTVAFHKPFHRVLFLGTKCQQPSRILFPR